MGLCRVWLITRSFRASPRLTRVDVLVGTPGQPTTVDFDTGSRYAMLALLLTKF